MEHFYMAPDFLFSCYFNLPSGEITVQREVFVHAVLELWSL